jgi:hypothetical protein
LNRVARFDPSRRAQLFRETADRMGLSEAVVEKDFWVCWTLNQIFTIEQFKERLLFKGGTSLSKVFGAIQRFSEDIAPRCGSASSALSAGILFPRGIPGKGRRV